MQSSDSPNPPCPKCQSKDVFEIVHDLAAAPELVSTKSWVHYEGICDIHPDRWKCGGCDFRWYPRDIVERDLDFLTWQLDHQEDESVKTSIRNRLSDLRTVITILANAGQQ